MCIFLEVTIDTHKLWGWINILHYSFHIVWDPSWNIDLFWDILCIIFYWKMELWRGKQVIRFCSPYCIIQSLLWNFWCNKEELHISSSKHIVVVRMCCLSSQKCHKLYIGLKIHCRACHNFYMYRSLRKAYLQDTLCTNREFLWFSFLVLWYINPRLLIQVLKIYLFRLYWLNRSCYRNRFF